jgi:hypothetical protein
MKVFYARTYLAWVLTLAVLVVTPLMSGCPSDGSAGLQGTLMFQNRPLAEALLEIYLKADKDRSIQPFATTVTDGQGHYQVILPPGQYFLIGKKRESTQDGRSRMLMAESPGNPHEVGQGIAEVSAFNLREMGREGLLAANGNTSLSGRVIFDNQPAARASVYVYTETVSGLMGPSYGEAVQTAEDGTFHIDVPAGRYSVVARKRLDGGRSGSLAPGDLNAPYAQNPVSVSSGQQMDLGQIVLQPVDSSVHAKRQAEGVFIKTETRLSGKVVDPEGSPVTDVYVFAYLDSRMVGKPVHVSSPTDAEGHFELYVSAGGTYYVGARSSYGGPLEPGEWVGTYDGSPDHGITVSQGARDDLGTITVREFW